MKKRSITIHGHRTSISLEDPFWNELQALATERGQSLANVVRHIDKQRDGGLSSALRLFVLAEMKKKFNTYVKVSEPLEH
jgi:predicted DNA-binding ribbon-helix-helix protein